ncbi:hypothetical protein BA895_12140 [Humibacillus sp. DSM 29435]|uniref:hypothetical protein n=1 Tax=Humibacillus sp. DSM 29435 TaxID=1869167 RepID=UPI000871BCA4|nr:hypothetical protein [Humibacillus sp. DSM 29435]OFE18375.1 hypothetical protein BA895_12140 [Humibacillus sp. DSM 29435]
MTASVRQIPHVLPDRIFEEYLTGLFTSRPDTVRLFASLAIARTHPGIATWAGSAIALGLPPDLGTSTARACSSSQTATPSHVIAAIAVAARALDGRDYRHLENQVRRLATTQLWFTQWARAHRPGTLAASQNHAVAWIWTHVAQGHANAAPSSPEAHQYPAAARQFAATLTTDQRQSLAWCIKPHVSQTTRPRSNVRGETSP